MSDRTVAVALHGGVTATAAIGAAVHSRLTRRRSRAASLVVPVGTGLAWLALDQAERRRPFREEWQQSQGDVAVDGTFLTLAFGPYLVGSAVGTALARRVKVRFGMDRLPTAVAVPVAIATYDLFHYSWHRLTHEWGPGWKLHAVHHSAPRLYWLNATRFHASETVIETAVETFLGHLFGLSDHQHVAYQLFRATYGQVQHANIAVDCGPLNRIFSTPELHRWHHSEIYAEGDTNYGAVVSIWDQLFGSYFRPDRPFTSKLGVGRMPNFPTTYATLQAVPVRWTQIKAANAATWLAER